MEIPSVYRPFVCERTFGASQNGKRDIFRCSHGSSPNRTPYFHHFLPLWFELFTHSHELGNEEHPDRRPPSSKPLEFDGCWQRAGLPPRAKEPWDWKMCILLAALLLLWQIAFSKWRSSAFVYLHLYIADDGKRKHYVSKVLTIAGWCALIWL